MRKKRLFITGTILCLVGLAGLIPSAFFWYQAKQVTEAASFGGQVVSEPTVVKTPDVATGKPVKLEIPSLGLSLDVEDGKYNPNNGEWTLSNNNVHYALITVQPNNKQGNTLIYGHYRPGVFSTLKSIKPGSEVFVKTDNGIVFTYRYTSNKVVDPRDVSLFEYEGKPMLTLQTCTGAFMQNRQLFSFEFVNFKRV